MNDLRELYQEVILDHNKNPRNFGKLDPADHDAEGYNPLCGDKLSLTVNLDGDTITDIKFEGSGCAISKASASVMTTMVKGKTVEEAKALFEEFHHMITDELTASIDMDKMGKLAVGGPQLVVGKSEIVVLTRQFAHILDGRERPARIVFRVFPQLMRPAMSRYAGSPAVQQINLRCRCEAGHGFLEKLLLAIRNFWTGFNQLLSLQRFALDPEVARPAPRDEEKTFIPVENRGGNRQVLHNDIQKHLLARERFPRGLKILLCKPSGADLL